MFLKSPEASSISILEVNMSSMLSRADLDDVECVFGVSIGKRGEAVVGQLGFLE